MSLEPRTFVLDNGLTLLLEADPQAQSVAAGYFVATGARDERAEEMGVSHFLEHLLFKGSERVSAAELNERLDALGGHFNAFTGEEATVYHAAALPEALPELLETLTELLRPALRPADLEPERGVILEEIAMYAEQPAVRVGEGLRAAYWGDQPLGFAVLGTAQTVGTMTREVLARNFAERYGAGRVTLALTGNFEPGEVLDWARRELAGWPAPAPQHAPQHAPLPAGPPASALHPGTVHHLPDDTLARTQVALALPGLPTEDPRRDAAALLAELIGGENGALYWALLDTGLADSADFSHIDYRGVGMFEGGFSCDPERLDEALAAYRQVLENAASLLTEPAVRRAARKAAVSSLLRAESPQGRLFALGLEYLATGRLLSAEAQAAQYMALTPADLRDVLRQCPLSGPTVCVLEPAVSGP